MVNTHSFQVLLTMDLGLIFTRAGARAGASPSLANTFGYLRLPLFWGWASFMPLVILLSFSDVLRNLLKFRWGPDHAGVTNCFININVGSPIQLHAQAARRTTAQPLKREVCHQSNKQQQPPFDCKRLSSTPTAST